MHDSWDNVWCSLLEIQKYPVPYYLAFPMSLPWKQENSMNLNEIIFHYRPYNYSKNWDKGGLPCWKFLLLTRVLVFASFLSRTTILRRKAFIICKHFIVRTRWHALFSWKKKGLQCVWKYCFTHKRDSSLNNLKKRIFFS